MHVSLKKSENVGCALAASSGPPLSWRNAPSTAACQALPAAARTAAGCVGAAGRRPQTGGPPPAARRPRASSRPAGAAPELRGRRLAVPPALPCCPRRPGGAAPACAAAPPASPAEGETVGKCGGGSTRLSTESHGLDIHAMCMPSSHSGKPAHQREDGEVGSSRRRVASGGGGGGPAAAGCSDRATNLDFAPSVSESAAAASSRAGCDGSHRGGQRRGLRKAQISIFGDRNVHSANTLSRMPLFATSSWQA